MNFDRRVAAKVFKSFLTCSSRIMRARGGEIRSFDGDRVMGIFLGPLMHNSAARCALNINYAFTQIIKPRFEERYAIFRENYELAHCVGVDTSEVLVVRGGVVNNNDLYGLAGRQMWRLSLVACVKIPIIHLSHHPSITNWTII